jgi:hypothetical protein
MLEQRHLFLGNALAGHPAGRDPGKHLNLHISRFMCRQLLEPEFPGRRHHQSQNFLL